VPRDDWQSFFWSLFKRTRNAIALIDDDRRHVEVNGAFVKLVGRQRRELIGRPVSDLVAGGPRLPLPQWRAQVFRGEWTGETDLVCADGSLTAVEFAAHPGVVGGRRLVLFVVIHSHRGGRRFRHVRGDDAPTGPLTDRELEIVHLVALGHTSAEIADELHIAHNTVRTHVRNAMAKVHARSRSHLVALSLAEEHLRPKAVK
jgi:PAS domain S-box-containing protein